MSQVHYVRLQPYDKKKGALCRRLVVAGQLFQEGRWYKLAPPMAARLGDLRQDTGCPYLQIAKTRQELNDINRRELAAAMAGPEAAAMAELMIKSAPAGDAPKEDGVVIQSEFDGLKVGEVSSGEVMSSVLTAPEAKDAPAPAKTVSRRRPRRRGAKAKAKKTSN